MIDVSRHLTDDIKEALLHLSLMHIAGDHTERRVLIQWAWVRLEGQHFKQAAG